MISILGKHLNLNDIVEVAWITDDNQYRLIQGRIYDYSNLFIHLDVSSDFLLLEEVEQVRRSKIKIIRKLDNNMWR